jgi:hypothetical protein
MAFVDINNKVRVVLTKYGKEQLSKGKLRFVYFGFSDDTVKYDLDQEPTIIKDVQGDADTNIYNGNKSTIIYKN